MIRISGAPTDAASLAGQYPQGSIERNIIDIMSSSSKVFRYSSVEQLSFEIKFRIKIIGSSRKLYKSMFSFKTFRRSICNSAYWNRTNAGGFLVRDDVKPSDAIKDILLNSFKYGSECATAIVIIYYLALVEILPEGLFNQLFSNIHLMNWEYTDSDLGIDSYRGETVFLPGDCRYFKNPQVNPATPQWQGENVIDLGNGTYYGHGLGIKSFEGIIAGLNKRRREGAAISAYALDSVTRPNFKYIADRYLSYSPRLWMEDENTVYLGDYDLLQSV